MYKDNNKYDEEIGKDEITKRTNDLLERFKENYIKNNNNDFINDAIINMTVCCKTYEKIFEGFVKWSTGQLEDIIEKIQEIDKKRDMR